MIIGIGCDVVDHNITQKLGWLANSRLLKKVFCTEELELIEKNKTDRFISGRFAAKEAVLKCLGTGMRDGISLNDISVEQTAYGQPFVIIRGELEKIANQMGIVHWHISITHTANTSTAFVIAESA